MGLPAMCLGAPAARLRVLRSDPLREAESRFVKRCVERDTSQRGGEVALFRMANHTAVRRHYFATAANGSMHLHIPYATRAR